MTNQTLCSHCNNTVVSKSRIFLLYITPLNLLQNQSFENCISGSILPSSWQLYCNFCLKDSGDVSMLQHFVLLPTFLILELSSNCIDQIFFLPIDYGCIRSTLCTQLYILIDVPVIVLQWWLKMTLAGCILMICVLVRSYTTFQDLLHSHPNSCFFFCNFWTLFTQSL